MLGAVVTTAAAGSGGFSRIVEPGGWTIPPHGKLIESGDYRPSREFPEGVTFSRFEGPSEPIALPWFHVDGRDLVLMRFLFRIGSVTRLEIGGRAVAYSAVATGVEVGTAFDAWWFDEQGTGTFTVYQPGMMTPDLVQWLRQRQLLAHRCPGPIREEPE